MRKPSRLAYEPSGSNQAYANRGAKQRQIKFGKWTSNMYVVDTQFI